MICESITRQNRRVRRMPLLPAIFTLLTLSASAYANIVVDGGFEAADPAAPADSTIYFTAGSSFDGGSWTVTQGTVGVDTQIFYVFDGNKSIFLDGDSAGPDSLTQTLTTVPGQTYNVSFWADADVTNTFSVTFGGAPVTGAPTSIAVNGFPSPNWLGNSGLFTLYSGTAVATSASTDLVFSATGFPVPNSNGVTVEIDDVSVSSAAPEPSGIAFLLASGLVGAAAFSGIRKRA
jgi:hypothetical protein